MKNLRLYCPLVNGSRQDFEFANGRKLIHGLLSDDWGPPPLTFVIEATAMDGHVVSIVIPYDDSSSALVTIKE